MGTIGFDIDRPPIYSNPKPFAIFPTPLSQSGRGVGGEGYWQIPIGLLYSESAIVLADRSHFSL
jgi:hypothetical protein